MQKMTVKELKEKIKNLPDSMEVMIEKMDDVFSLSLLEKAQVQKCTFSDGELKAQDDCLVLSDEI